MKIIVLVRHGKSSWEFDVSDRKRPLKTRGKNDAKLIVNQFIKENRLPKNIFSSPAKRALDTCKIFAKSLSLPKNTIEVVDDLYDFGGESVIKFIKNLPDDYDEIMIFGHNHAFTSISNIFGSIFIDNVPTCGLVKIRFEIDSWSDLEQGKTEQILIPKELK
ncbi:SixA phosphatase family protein [Winogradskyella sp. PG-2]|uniref:SixA phosphatase family protein n=1 Tax=Winogradskyella sp. PG-2 TaxID=754409 RepID=UPI0004585D27|nr:phosphoglycerate mutase family protein [Winogradskyella sp. PG-2]BAO77154.1 phosphoglycerate/bisphosphoglycerate mutase [Winogradskyella sp. PG-2]